MSFNSSTRAWHSQDKQLPKFEKAIAAQSKNITVTADEINRKTGTIYKGLGNLLIIKETCRTVPHAFDQTVRGVITGFSTGAGVRMRSYLRSCLADYTVMLTLTYPFSYPSNGRETKEHLRRFLQELKRAASREKGIAIESHSSFWFLEFQQRGAPHYHIFTTWAPDKDWVARRWYEIVNSEDIRHLHAGTRTEYLRQARAGTISYASKYAAKLEQKVCPENYENVGRWWGVHGYRATVSADTFVSRTAEKDPSIHHTVENLFKWLEGVILSGEAEVMVREKGVLVVNLMNDRVRKRARMRISNISSKLMMGASMFFDAELDYGETLQ